MSTEESSLCPLEPLPFAGRAAGAPRPQAPAAAPLPPPRDEAEEWFQNEKCTRSRRFQQSLELFMENVLADSAAFTAGGSAAPQREPYTAAPLHIPTWAAATAEDATLPADSLDGSDEESEEDSEGRVHAVADPAEVAAENRLQQHRTAVHGDPPPWYFVRSNVRALLLRLCHRCDPGRNGEAWALICSADQLVDKLDNAARQLRRLELTQPRGRTEAMEQDAAALRRCMADDKAALAAVLEEAGGLHVAVLQAEADGQLRRLESTPPAGRTEAMEEAMEALHLHRGGDKAALAAAVEKAEVLLLHAVVEEETWASSSEEEEEEEVESAPPGGAVPARTAFTAAEDELLLAWLADAEATGNPDLAGAARHLGTRTTTQVQMHVQYLKRSKPAKLPAWMRPAADAHPASHARRMAAHPGQQKMWREKRKAQDPDFAKKEAARKKAARARSKAERDRERERGL